MAFSDFKYPAVVRDLGLTERTADLFAEVRPVPATAVLTGSLSVNVSLATLAHSEASRSTWIVGPVLSDFWGRYRGGVSLFAGVELAADRDAGLTGFCDFLIGRGPQLPHIQAPLIVMFEAKRDSIPDGLGQGIAGMVGVQRYNRREGSDADPAYGCVTTGSQWRFLRLSGTAVTIDLVEYSITQVDKLLGILTYIVGPPPT